METLGLMLANQHRMLRLRTLVTMASVQAIDAVIATEVVVCRLEVHVVRVEAAVVVAQVADVLCGGRR